jgi:DNA-binding Xre family transcriptional regulator
MLGMELIEVVAGRVKELRHASGLEEQELARRAGISLQTVSNLETGRLRDLKLSTLSKIAAALAVSPEELLSPVDRRAA